MHGERAVFHKEDDVVYVRAVAGVFAFAFFQGVSRKAVCTVHIQFGVLYGHFRGFYIVERTQFGLALAALSVLLFKVFEILDRVTHHIGQVVGYLGHLLLKVGYQFVGLVGVVARYAAHLYFEQPLEVVVRDRREQPVFERFEFFTGELYGLFVRKVVEQFVYALLYEYFFQRRNVPLGAQFVQTPLKFLAQHF